MTDAAYLIKLRAVVNSNARLAPPHRREQVRKDNRLRVNITGDEATWIANKNFNFSIRTKRMRLDTLNLRLDEIEEWIAKKVAAQLSPNPRTYGARR